MKPVFIFLVTSLTIPTVAGAEQTLSFRGGAGSVQQYPYAAAQSAPDYYITGAIGASVSGSWEGDINPLIPSLVVEGDFEPSPLVRIGVGHAYTGPLRTELELSYRQLDFSDTFTNVLTGFPSDADGEATVTALMVNGLYDFDLPTSDYVIYVGAGLGVAHVDVDLQRGPGDPGFQVINGNYTTLAGQLRLGAERGLANGITVFADYTYLHVTGQDFDGFNTFGGSVRQLFDPISSHELAIGLRYGF